MPRIEGYSYTNAYFTDYRFDVSGDEDSGSEDNVEKNNKRITFVYRRKPKQTSVSKEASTVIVKNTK